MKTRGEIIEGLKWILESHAAAVGCAGDVREFIEPAIELLRVPEVAEIEAARYLCAVDHKPECRCEYCTVSLALDALAREPELQATAIAYGEALGIIKQDGERIASLEAQVARVRGLLDAWDRLAAIDSVAGWYLAIANRLRAALDGEVRLTQVGGRP